MQSPRRALFGVLVLTAVSGCGAFRRLAGNDTVNLEKAEVKSMSVDIRRSQKTICPREPVQMAVFAEVVFEGEKKAKAVETWVGHTANKNDKLEFTEFAFQSNQGSFDTDGWFSPSPNLLATAGKEFEIKSVYRRRPDKFSFSTTYKPDYACIKSGGHGGSSGQVGASGTSGQTGSDGAYGSASQAGGAGGDGTSGTSGSQGSDGSEGPQLKVYATIVKTAFYDRLVAIALDGESQDFLLVPEGQSIRIHANGGAGGDGGAGGRGGTGGHGGGGNPGGAGGKGASGAHGGNGGNGGMGGHIDLVYDARFPDLRTQIYLEAAGGGGGIGGGGGAAGNGGGGGSGIAPPSSSGQPAPTAASGQRGPDGTPGRNGNPGRTGADGRITANAGAPKEKFVGQPGVTVL